MSGRPSPQQLVLPLLVLPWLCACESGPSASFSGERVDVRVLGGGFVEAAGERVPLETFILTMRRRLREGDEAAGQGAWVKVDVDPDGGAQARADFDRLFDALTAMGVRQIEYL